MRLVIGFVCIMMLLASGREVSAQKLPVAIIKTAEDSVGGRLVFSIKEGIRRSSSMELVEDPADARVWMHIVTLDPDDQGYRTIYSIVWTAETLHQSPVTMYLTSSVGTCGGRRVAECADGLVADTDEQVSNIVRMIKAAIEQGRQK